MNVWLITTGETHPMLDTGDRWMKTANLADALAHAGHCVTWWTSTFDHLKKCQRFESDAEIDWFPNVRVKFLRTPGYRSNISVARYFNHLVLARRFWEEAQKSEVPDIIYCSQPPLEIADTAVRFSKLHGIPCFVDIRDLWPDELSRRIPGPIRPIARIFLTPMYRACEHALSGATGITAVSEDYLNWGLKKAGRKRSDNDRIFMLGYPRLRVTHHETIKKALEGTNLDLSKKIVLFVSTFNNAIDLTTVIEAARRLRHRDDVLFVICGSGEGEAGYKEQASGLANLCLLGWVDAAKIGSLLQVAYIGLVAYNRTTAVSLPNKFFEYLSAGVPVVTSLSGSAKEIVENEKCGLFYSAENSEALAKTIELYLSDEQRRDSDAERARHYFDNHCAVDVIYPNLVRFLEEAVMAHGLRPEK